MRGTFCEMLQCRQRRKQLVFFSLIALLVLMHIQKVNHLEEKIEMLNMSRKAVSDNINTAKPGDKTIGTSDLDMANMMELRIWVDVPTEFPWRKCVLDYLGNAAHGYCTLNKHAAATWIVPVFMDKFRLVNLETKRCLEPRAAGDNGKRTVAVQNCGSGYWSYQDELLEWSGGGCLTADYNNYLVLGNCDRDLQEQRFEFGSVRRDEQDNIVKLLPLNVENWKHRQNLLRMKELETSRLELERVIAFEHPVDANIQPRRAVVFYLDRGVNGLAQLSWWILAWKLLGLNSESEKFDIVVFIHPAAVNSLNEEDCKEYRSDMEFGGQGKCIFVPLEGASYRDHKYDGYLNSHECLVNEKSAFLSKYSHLLRSDLDTFPGPKLLGNWPDRITVNKEHAYTFRNSDGESAITTALKEAMSDVGLKHQGIHDISSTWFGPASTIIRLSHLTTAFFIFLRSYLFGPGTKCRCASCIHLPKGCQWGSGIYAGTLLLYAQELALNFLWTREEYDTLPFVPMDMGTTSHRSICDIWHFHVFHSDDNFSKFRFSDGLYKDFDMKSINVTTSSGYAMYIALKSSGQGIGEKELSEQYGLGEDGSLGKLCKSV